MLRAQKGYLFKNVFMTFSLFSNNAQWQSYENLNRVINLWLHVVVAGGEEMRVKMWLMKTAFIMCKPF